MADPKEQNRRTDSSTDPHQADGSVNDPEAAKEAADPIPPADINFEIEQLEQNLEAAGKVQDGPTQDYLAVKARLEELKGLRGDKE